MKHAFAGVAALRNNFNLLLAALPGWMGVRLRFGAPQGTTAGSSDIRFQGVDQGARARSQGEKMAGAKLGRDQNGNG